MKSELEARSKIASRAHLLIGEMDIAVKETISAPRRLPYEILLPCLNQVLI